MVMVFVCRLALIMCDDWWLYISIGDMFGFV